MSCLWRGIWSVSFAALILGCGSEEAESEGPLGGTNMVMGGEMTVVMGGTGAGGETPLTDGALPAVDSGPEEPMNGGTPAPDAAPPPADMGDDPMSGGAMAMDAAIEPPADSGMAPADPDAAPMAPDAMPMVADAMPMVADAMPMVVDAMPVAPPDAPPMPPIAPEECVELVAATRAFLALLEPDEVDRAHVQYGGGDHRRYEFLPPVMRDRTGLSMRDMDGAKLEAVGAILQAAMSAPGYARVEAIRNMELILRERETPANPSPAELASVRENRDPMNYFIQIFGEPSVDGETPWGLRFEGHHLSIQTATLACQVFSATPAFWGAGPDVTPLSPMVEPAVALWNSLAPELQGQALVQFRIPGQEARDHSIVPQPALGLAGEAMDMEQKDHLRAVIAAYLDNMSTPIAADRFAAIEAAGIDAVHFAYNQGNYRVSGPTFLIEFVYHDGRRDHIHSAWRDYSGDFGDDLIARHMGMEHGGDPQMMEPDPNPGPGECANECVGGDNACCGGCLAGNGVCYAQTRDWCATFEFTWCGD